MTQSGHELKIREVFESVLVSDNCRVLVFQGPFLFNKRLVSHTIGYKIGVDFENCEMHCYLENKCVSVNYQIDTETCELNNATRLKYDENFIEENGYLYHGADVSFCFNSSYLILLIL